MAQSPYSGADRGGRALLTAASVVVVIAGMKAAQPILVPFLLSAFIAFLFAPLLFWLTARGLPSAVALLVVVSGILALGGVFGVLVGGSAGAFTQQLPFYQSRLEGEAANVLAWLQGLGLPVPDDAVKNGFDPAAAMQFAGGILSGLSGMLSNAFLIFMTVIFILLEAAGMPRKLSVAMGAADSGARADEFVKMVRRYLAIKSVTSLVTGILVGVWLLWIGVGFPFLWGVLAFLLNFVPTFGSIIAAIPPVFLALVELGPGPALAAAAGIVAVNLVIGNGVEPRAMGQSVGLSPLVVFLSLLFWGWVLGPVGMVLAIPLTVVVRLALDSGEETRWIAVLLGPSVPASAAAAAKRE